MDRLAGRHVATFSFASGIIHEYYAIALAPAIAALVAIGASLLWARQRTSGRAVRTGGRGGRFGPVCHLAAHSSGWSVRRGGSRGGYRLTHGRGLMVLPVAGRWQRGTAIAAIVLLLIGPFLFTAQTVLPPHTGSLPHRRAPGGGQPRRTRGGRGGGPGGAPGFAPAGGPTMGPGGGLLDATTPSSTLVEMLTQNASDYEWVAAAIGSQNASGYQLASGCSVMPIGGFNGSDPSPRWPSSSSWSTTGRSTGSSPRGGMGPGGAGGSQISSWVEQNFTATTVDGTTLYDLSGGGRHDGTP